MVPWARLSESDVDAFVQANPRAIVLFTSTGDSECRAREKEVAAALSAMRIAFAAGRFDAEADDGRALAAHGVRALPTVAVFRDGWKIYQACAAQDGWLDLLDVFLM